MYSEIYFENISHQLLFNKHIPHSVFYDAWKLRGDDPHLYLNSWESDIEKLPNITYWERCRINYFYPRSNYVRKSKEIKLLYHEYHFNPKIKREGRKIKQFDVSDDYVKVVCEVQKHMQQAVKQNNIAIECNPTSNFLIGTFRRYDKHPIISFYNLGLTSNPKDISECNQLFVSINTDDQGIFGTSLENEYALMAIALEKAKNDNGRSKYSPTMIYQWLDNIRRMGIEQSFDSI
ncbi:MAG: hypothetical protein EOO10_19630 [Chitinophagaceae bacterium]|nr:MAG: hypothetical protein EOO10_19630 [Chitinophagaceae bacterium]